ncbi:uncharacterized protein [Drosophila pseudoobscura]|uniref:Uncharacterized protein isoform X1 n=1 Tax=Drosophila pseudoobscura pseudoobscura TaxID=46245 RepID=A0A6I8UXG1_DROPS|nr:uncharacterized protein LOC6902858 isoform X1 [Drosophila pseudoobscura]
MPKSKKAKSKSETLGKSSNRSHAIAKGNKVQLRKKSPGKTVPGTSKSVFSPRNTPPSPSAHEKVQKIHAYSHESIQKNSSTQKQIKSQKHSEDEKQRSPLHANDPEDDTNPFPDQGISLVKLSDNVIYGEDEHIYEDGSKVSLSSNPKSGFSTPTILDAKTSVISNVTFEKKHHAVRPKTSLHKKPKGSTVSIHKRPQATQESIHKKAKKLERNDAFSIHLLKKRPKPEVDIQWKAPDDNISVRSENAGGDEVRKPDHTNSETGDKKNLEITSYMDILNQIRDLPNWNELDETATFDFSEEIHEAKAEDPSGKFRDPLAAASTDLNLTKGDTETDHEGLSEAQPSQQNLSRLSLSAISSSEIEESDSFDDDLSFKTIFEVPGPVKRTSLVFDLEEGKSEVVVKVSPCELNIMVYDFLDELICKVIDVTTKPERLTHRVLDKEKLMDTLLAEANKHHLEQIINQSLSKRITDILVRRCKYSLVKQDTNEITKENNRVRCLSALNELDYWLKREKKSTEIARNEVERNVIEENTKRTEDDEQFQRLENLINSTILNCQNVSDHLKILTRNIIRRLRKMRDELSVTRLNLILKQHTYSHIKTKVEEMDTISENLTMHRYLSVEAQVENLSRTLESKNLSIVKSSSLINSKLHSVSHLRCRRKALSRKLSAAQYILGSLRQKFQDLRLKAYRCNTKHNKLYKCLDDVRYQGGIMLYPQLMTDYDQTLELFAKKRSEIEVLRAEHDILIERIETIEEELRITLKNRKGSRNQLRASTLVDRMAKI